MPGRYERIFFGSALCRDKWRERADYRQRTISLALSGLGEIYRPPGTKGKQRERTTATIPQTHQSAPFQPVLPAEAGVWPSVSAEMFYGLAGDIVRVIEPHSEADPVALLVQILAAFGNAIGRSAHFMAEADQHFGNLFVVMVGISSKGRKGTSWGHVRRLFALADPQWEGFCIQSGLSSGEGLIWHVRDAIEKLVKNKTTGELEPEVVDPGVTDKRLLVMEIGIRFCPARGVPGRQHPVGDPARCLGPGPPANHDQEQRRQSDRRPRVPDRPCHRRRAAARTVYHRGRQRLRQPLPVGVHPPLQRTARRRQLAGGETCTRWPARLSAAIEFGRQTGRVARDENARALWRAVYHDLSEGGPGLSGAVTSRGEAQTMRLALLYALLDCQRTYGANI